MSLSKYWDDNIPTNYLEDDRSPPDPLLPKFPPMHVHAKLQQAKCSDSWVINSALDFGQLWTSIANIFGTDQAIDKRERR